MKEKKLTKTPVRQPQGTSSSICCQVSTKLPARSLQPTLQLFNSQSQLGASADRVCYASDSAPRNKKLKLLGDMEPSSTRSNDVTDVHSHHALQLEITSYLGPVAVTEEEKLSPLMFWKRNEIVFPHPSLLARVFLTPSASSVPVESLFSITGLTRTHDDHL